MTNYTFNFDSKLEEVLGRNYPSYVRDELFSMICSEDVKKEDIIAYLDRTNEYSVIPQFYYASSLEYYLRVNWEFFPKSVVEDWEDKYNMCLIDDNGDIKFSELAENIINSSKFSFDSLTVGEICQLNNLFLREVMTDEYGMSYELYDEYVSEHKDEFVGFVEVMACDNLREHIYTTGNYGFADDVADGAVAYAEVFKLYNDSFGIKMDVDFSSEVAIIQRDDSYMHISGMHINTLVQSNAIWDSICERAKKYLTKHSHKKDVIDNAKYINQKRLGNV